MHLQPVAAAAVVETAVAEPSTAVAEPLPTAFPEKKSEEEEDTPEDTPDCPMQEGLPKLKPPVPTAAIDGCIEDDAMHVEKPMPPVALSTPAATLLALARTIRQPKAYVGYSAFILLGLVYGCRPLVWEPPCDH